LLALKKRKWHTKEAERYRRYMVTNVRRSSYSIASDFAVDPGRTDKVKGPAAAHPPPPHLWHGSACPPPSPLPLLSLPSRTSLAQMHGQVRESHVMKPPSASRRNMLIRSEPGADMDAASKEASGANGQFRRRSACNASAVTGGAPQSSSPSPFPPLPGLQDARLPLSLPTPEEATLDFV
jgi:hypothetical protein